MRMRDTVRTYLGAGMVAGLMIGLIFAFIQILNALIFFSFFETHVKMLAPFYLVSPFILYIFTFALAGTFWGIVYGMLMRKKTDRPSPVALTVFLCLFALPIYVLLFVYWTKFTESHVTVAPFFSSPIRSFGIVAIFLGLWIFFMRAVLLHLFAARHGRFSTILWTGIIFCVAASAILYGTLPRQVESRDREPQNPGVSKTGEDRINVVLVTVDTLRRDYLGCYGNSELKTPHIDRLAGKGVKFMNPVVHAPITLPSHTSILTSRYPVSHGVRSNARFKASSTLVTLPEILNQHGYNTAAFVSAIVLDSIFGLDQGFTLYDDSFNTTEEKMLLVFKNRVTIFRFLEKLKLMPFPQLQEAERDAKEVTEAVLAWLKKSEDRPFFLWVHYFDPHAPLIPPEPYRSLQLKKVFSGLLTEEHKEVQHYKALYRAEIEFTDFQIGRLLDYLEKAGEMEHTIIILTSDHGQSIQDHGYLGHTDTIHYTTVNSPLIITCRNILPEGVTIETLVRSIDIMPTILDLLQIDSGIEMDGRSLVPLIYGKEEWDPIDVAYAETLFRKDPDAQYMSLQTATWKFIRNLDGTRQELYRIAEDPEEMQNLAADYPEMVAKFNHELQESIQKSRQQADVIALEPGGRIKEGLRQLGYLE